MWVRITLSPDVTDDQIWELTGMVGIQREGHIDREGLLALCRLTYVVAVEAWRDDLAPTKSP
jgi:hypothetical protein